MEYKLKNLSSQREILLYDNKMKDYFVKTLDWGQVKGSHNATPYINLVGSHVDSTSFGARDVAIVGFVTANHDAEMKEKKAWLNKLVNPRDDLSLTTGQYELVIRPDSSVAYSTNKKENNGLLCSFLIQATAYMPFFTLRQKHAVTDSSMKGLPMFPLIIPEGKGRPFGIIPGETINNIYNNGDVECGFVVRFTAKGAARNPMLTNNLTGKMVEALIDMELGDVVEISTVSGNKYAKLIRDDVETDIFRTISTRSSMDATLSVGRNHLTVSAGGNASNLEMTVTYTPYFLEVQ